MDQNEGSDLVIFSIVSFSIVFNSLHNGYKEEQYYTYRIFLPARNKKMMKNISLNHSSFFSLNFLKD